MIVFLQICKSVKQVDCCKFNYARVVFVSFDGVRLASVRLPVRCDHYVVASQCVANHARVLVRVDLLGERLRTINSIKSIDLLARLVRKIALVLGVPIDLLLSVRVSIGVLWLEAHSDVEVVKKRVERHFVSSYESLHRGCLH